MGVKPDIEAFLDQFTFEFFNVFLVFVAVADEDVAHALFALTLALSRVRERGLFMQKRKLVLRFSNDLAICLFPLQGHSAFAS